MKLLKLVSDQSGTAAIEFAITSSVFVMLLIGIVDGSYALFTQAGIQHGAEMAARCATVNTSTCGSTSAIQSYAVSQSWGLSVPASTFTVSTPACGNQVAASYNYAFLTDYFGVMHVTLTGRSCFPK